MPPDKRRQLYQNALKRRENGGQAIIDLIEASGLPLHYGKGLTSDDPTFLRMQEIIWSPEGQKALVNATEPAKERAQLTLKLKRAALLLGLFGLGYIEYFDRAPAGGEHGLPFYLSLDPRKSRRKQLLCPPARHDHEAVIIPDD